MSFLYNKNLMQRPLCFILPVLLLSGCVKTKFDDKDGKSSSPATISRSVTCCGVNVGSSGSTKMWGVNGHPDNQVQYSGNIDAQLDLMQELGMTQYRVDMGATRFGELVGDNLTKFNELMTKCQQRGITVLPVLINKEYQDSNYTRDDAYYIGAILGNGFASRYGSYFDVYEVGNEEDTYTLHYNVVNGKKLYYSGENLSDYIDPNFEKVYYFYNGIIQGIKAADPTAKCIINAQSSHFVFLQLLSMHNVQYDIIGWHWYDDVPDKFSLTLDKLATYNKDVWFTEFNSRANKTMETFSQTSDFVYNYLNIMETKSFIKKVFPYELFNEDGAFEEEKFYGLTYWNTPFVFTAYTKKPVVATWKYEIEENLYGNEDFIYSMFLYCNDRVPDAGGLAYWTSRLTSNPDRQSIINEFLPQEAYGRWVEEQYFPLMDVSSFTDDLWNYWLGRMQSGTTREQMICELCASDQFYTLGGSTAGGYVTRLFNKLLGRAPSSSESTTWAGALNSGSTRYSVANSIIHTQEYYSNFVNAQFHKLLRRTGSIEQSAIDYYTGKLSGGWMQADLINTLLMSDEYWYSGINEGYLRRHPGYPLN